MKSGDSRREEAETRVDAGKALTRLGCIGLILLFGACSTMEDIGEATSDGLSAAGARVKHVRHPLVGDLNRHRCLV